MVAPDRAPPAADPTVPRAAELAAAGAAPARDGRPQSWAKVYADGAAFVGRGMLAGLVCGALVGGVGGRLAMFLLRLTSADAVRGLETDDGFAIGAVTGATLFLLIVTTALGAIGGLLYLGVRPWLPPRGRPVVFGLVGAVLGGLLFINPDGRDFTLLGPRWLAVALFVLLPAAYGVSLSLLAERLLRPRGWQRNRWRWLAALPLVVPLGTGVLGLGVVLVIGLLVGVNRTGHVVRLWQSGPVVWLGRGALAVALGIGGVLLVRDIAAVL